MEPRDTLSCVTSELIIPPSREALWSETVGERQVPDRPPCQQRAGLEPTVSLGSQAQSKGRPQAWGRLTTSSQVPPESSSGSRPYRSLVLPVGPHLSGQAAQEWPRPHPPSASPPCSLFLPSCDPSSSPALAASGVSGLGAGLAPRSSLALELRGSPSGFLVCCRLFSTLASGLMWKQI